MRECTGGGGGENQTKTTIRFGFLERKNKSKKQKYTQGLSEKVTVFVGGRTKDECTCRIPTRSNNQNSKGGPSYIVEGFRGIGERTGDKIRQVSLGKNDLWRWP